MIGPVSGTTAPTPAGQTAPGAHPPSDPDPRPAARDRVEISPEALALLAKEAGGGSCSG